ncbi:MAG: ATP-binding cassette subfamily F protein uup [Flavobacteriales bacterium]|jgi:ATP-binding cassette subfamily F protein uup|tara:strand:+ start:8607 stop:10478 length:1872 start_codon:yes stop_codon:yes gene_type:complete
MNYLSVSDLSKSFGELKLFKGVSFGLEKGQKVGLVAKNGAGKSTLLNILLGKDIQDEGQVVFKDELSVCLLEQEPSFGDAKTIEDYINDSQNPAIRLIHRYEQLLESGDTESNEFTEVIEKIDEQNAWGVDVIINEVLTSLKFPDKKMSVVKLSGGQARRLALAKALIDEPDVLFLDEPTNHLDFDMVEWLEKYIADSNLTLLLITHDRYFLDNVCSEIIELSPEGIYNYKGDYEYYLTKKAERENNESVVANKAKNLFKTELDWLRKQPKARGTKSKSRVDAAYELEKKSKNVRVNSNLEISSVMTRMGSKIIEIEELNKEYGDLKILKDFTYFFKRGEKVGIIGKNGTGKSTFLNLITGKDDAYKGSIEVGSTVKFGYYNQKGLKFRNDMKVIDVVKDIAEIVQTKDGSKITASQMLTHFQFEPKKQHTHVELLSGGEKKRLYLVTVLMENPNFLILDEPTNDLDLGTLTALENYLLDFNGCVVIVSHDRYFLDRICEHLFVFEGEGKVRDFPGNYTEYREHERLNPVTETTKVKKVQKAISQEVKTKVSKLTYKEKIEMEKSAKELEKLETDKSKLEFKLSSGDLSGQEINDVSVDLGKLMEKIEEVTMIWMELAEKDEA